MSGGVTPKCRKFRAKATGRRVFPAAGLLFWCSQAQHIAEAICGKNVPTDLKLEFKVCHRLFGRDPLVPTLLYTATSYVRMCIYFRKYDVGV